MGGGVGGGVGVGVELVSLRARARDRARVRVRIRARVRFGRCARTAGELLLQRVVVDVPQLGLRGGEVAEQAGREVGREEVVDHHVREGRRTLEARRQRRDIARPRPEHVSTVQARQRRWVGEQVLRRDLDGTLVVAAERAHRVWLAKKAGEDPGGKAVDAAAFASRGRVVANARGGSADDHVAIGVACETQQSYLIYLEKSR